jgi:hypothetical protein
LDKFILEGSNVVVLPIELLDFKAKLTGDDVLLDWTTASEINNDYFTIQRSLDAINFESIAHVSGAGNSNDVLSYNDIDSDVDYEGVIYYRLMQTDFDGQTSYSGLVPVDLKSLIQNTWSVYPNPSNQVLNVSGKVAALSLMNILGEQVQLQQNSLSVINLADVANGTYFIKVWLTNGTVDVKRFIVSH